MDVNQSFRIYATASALQSMAPVAASFGARVDAAEAMLKAAALITIAAEVEELHTSAHISEGAVLTNVLRLTRVGAEVVSAQKSKIEDEVAINKKSRAELAALTFPAAR